MRRQKLRKFLQDKLRIYSRNTNYNNDTVQSAKRISSSHILSIVVSTFLIVFIGCLVGVEHDLGIIYGSSLREDTFGGSLAPPFPDGIVEDIDDFGAVSDGLGRNIFAITLNNAGDFRAKYYKNSEGEYIDYQFFVFNEIDLYLCEYSCHIYFDKIVENENIFEDISNANQFEWRDYLISWYVEENELTRTLAYHFYDSENNIYYLFQLEYEYFDEMLMPDIDVVDLLESMTYYTPNAA